MQSFFFFFALLIVLVCVYDAAATATDVGPALNDLFKILGDCLEKIFTALVRVASAGRETIQNFISKTMPSLG